MLLDELNKNDSLNYEPVAVLTNLVAEAPAVGPGTFDVRFTDRVVLLVRTDLNNNDFELEDEVAQHFSRFCPYRRPLSVRLRSYGYISADIERWTTFRFVTAHLESFEEQLGLPFPFFRFAQATELLQGPAATGLPVVLAGDFNADGANPTDPTYQLLLSGGLQMRGRKLLQTSRASPGRYSGKPVHLHVSQSAS